MCLFSTQGLLMIGAHRVSKMLGHILQSFLLSCPEVYLPTSVVSFISFPLHVLPIITPRK